MLANGATFLGLEVFADPEKGAEWLKDRQEKMATEPDIFRRHYLGDMTVVSGHPVYSNWNQQVHCPEIYKESGIPIVPGSIYLAGWDCVAAGTMIYDPMSDVSRPVESLVGSESWVLSLDGPAKASSPWIAGVKPIYRVELESGQAIRVTAGHKFLTPDGWRRLDELWKNHNPRIAAFPKTGEYRLECSEGPVQRWACASGRQYGRDPYDRPQMHTKPDLKADYRSGHRFCDGPPPLVSDTDQLETQLQGDVREHAPRGHNADVPVSKLGYTHPYRQFAHPSSAGFAPVGPCEVTGGCQVSQASCGQPLLERQSESQYLRQSECRQQVPVCGTHKHPVGSERGVHVSTYPDYIQWVGVVSIEFDGVEPFYDIHVPGPNNYLANGIWHHNCGQSLCPAFTLLQVTQNPFQAHAILELTSPGGESMAAFAPRVASALIKRLPGQWDQIRHYADATVTTRNGTNGKSAQKEAKAHGFEGPTKLRPVSNAWLPRYGAVTWLLSRRIALPGDQTVAGFFVDALHCPTLLRGFQGHYKWKVSAQGDEKGPGQVILEPVKNHYSHVHDSLQYPCIKLRQMVEGGGAKIIKPGVDDEDDD